MSSWGRRSYFAGDVQNNNGNNDHQDGYGGGGQQYEPTGRKKRGSSSRLKKSSGSKIDADADDYPKYAGTGDEADDNNYYSNDRVDDDDHHNSGGNHYNAGTVVLGSPYYGNVSPYAGGYGNRAPYGGGSGYGHGGGDGGGYAPYSNAPGDGGFWAPQDGTRSPLYINTKEVHVYGAPPGYENDSHGNYQRRRGGGFFGPALHAVGNFFDRRFGLSDRD